MPLTDKQKNLLYEIYEISYGTKTVVTSGGGATPTPTFFDVQQGVKQQLEEAIALIDLSSSYSARVAEILEEYENFALDWSTIDREGYLFKPARNLRRVQKALYVYTGIVFTGTQNNNAIALG